MRKTEVARNCTSSNDGQDQFHLATATDYLVPVYAYGGIEHAFNSEIDELYFDGFSESGRG